MSFKRVDEFENLIAEFFGAPYAIAVDSCTHGVELCLRLTEAKFMTTPTRTYPSIPMLANKLGINHKFEDYEWSEYYYITGRVIDAAVLWRPNSYVPETFMNLSFQYRKHLNLERGGRILLDNYEDYLQLKSMSYDGRSIDTWLEDIPWREQNIKAIGYHYYMTPDTAAKGIYKFNDALATPPKLWTDKDYPDLTQMEIFNDTQ